MVFNKRKKLEIKTVFNADEDEVAAPKKRKLVPLGNFHDLIMKFCIIHSYMISYRLWR